MRTLQVRNVNQALPEGVRLLLNEGYRRNSRNGPVRLVAGPVLTEYRHPRERVLFSPARDANPFFHLLESLWMLAGRDDLEYVKALLPRMDEFSDDGSTLHGAYGHRWRKHFDRDQLNVIWRRLSRDRDDRRCVLSMWDPFVDLGRDGRDVPCNTQVYFSLGADLALDMTVMSRSHDIIWGAYGANAVHFSMLHEVMAGMIDVPVGRMWQFSNNYHAYVDVLDGIAGLADYVAEPPYRAYADAYSVGDVEPYPVYACADGQDRMEWIFAAERFVRHGVPGPGDPPFFAAVAEPMRRAFLAHKRHCTHEAIDMLEADCKASDWRKAGVEWLTRRLPKAG